MMQGLNKTTTAYANHGISSIEASELGSSKCDLVADGDKNPNERFEAKYGKWWPFRLMKTINLVLILAITIGATICAVKSNDGLRWSSCWNIFRSFNYISEDWTHPDRIFVISTIVLALAFVTYALHYIGKKKPGKSQQFMTSIGITDICLTLFMASMLVPILFSFTCRSIAEIRWFYPRLSNESMTLAELVEWKEDRRGYHPYGGRYELDNFGRRLTTTPSPVPTTPAPWVVRQQEVRKNSILLRLCMDPTIALFTFLVFFLNLVYAVRLLWLFKRTKVWSSDYRGMHPNCFKLDMAYANFWPFGLLKATQWLVPLISFYIFFYVNNDEVLPTHKITLAIVSIVWFVQWIFYLQKVRLHPGSMEVQQQQQKQQHDLAQMAKKGLIYSGVALFIYFILSFIIFSSYRRSVEFIQIVLNIAICLHAASILFTFLLLKRHGGPNAYSGFGLKIPGVTVNISINVQKNEIASSANQQNAVENANVEEGGKNVNAQKGVENI